MVMLILVVFNNRAAIGMQHEEERAQRERQGFMLAAAFIASRTLAAGGYPICGLRGALCWNQTGMFYQPARIVEKEPEEPNDLAYCREKKNCKGLIDGLCDSYLIILPKLMGCVLCQYAHAMSGSERFVHFNERKAQLEHVKEMLRPEDFDPKEVLRYFETIMCPFKGEFSKDFYRQCKMALEHLLQKWQ